MVATTAMVMATVMATAMANGNGKGDCDGNGYGNSNHDVTTTMKKLSVASNLSTA
jgi:hypothetical protein